jgi:hypothetical protein
MPAERNTIILDAIEDPDTLHNKVLDLLRAWLREAWGFLSIHLEGVSNGTGECRFIVAQSWLNCESDISTAS